jgi:AcrR family transcriptional regulator
MMRKMRKKTPTKAARERKSPPGHDNTRSGAKSGGRSGAKSAERRADIIDALRRSMIERGYAQTSLVDIAAAADMSASHLLYYFPSKEAVLEELCEQVLNRLFETVSASRSQSPEERIHLLVGNVSMANSEFAIAVELTALSIHRPTIREKLSKYSHDVREYLTDLFAQLPRQPGLSAADAAEIAAGLWEGLFMNSHYEPDLDEGRMRSLFRRTLFALGNTGYYGWQSAPTDASAEGAAPAPSSSR